MKISEKSAAWLRPAIIGYVRRHPGVSEDLILRHLEKTTPPELDDDGPADDAVDMLFEMVKAGDLTWHEQKGKPDAALRYRLA